MKSIWHTPDEKPKHNERILAHCTMDEYAVFYAYPIEWGKQVREYHVEQWTSFDDLLALESKLQRTVEALNDIIDDEHLAVKLGEIAKAALKDMGE